MTIPQFLGKAVDGGWKPKNLNTVGKPPSWIKQVLAVNSKFIERHFLDPEAWKAVGKVEGWYKLDYTTEDWPKTEARPDGIPYGELKAGTWLAYWHRMIDALAEGKTIEQYIETL